jgi:hypothetical protein
MVPYCFYVFHVVSPYAWHNIFYPTTNDRLWLLNTTRTRHTSLTSDHFRAPHWGLFFAQAAGLGLAAKHERKHMRPLRGREHRITFF